MHPIHSFCFNPFQENTFLIMNDAKEVIIVDPGCYTEEEQNALIQFIKKNELTPVLLLNTHCHLDHVFGNQFVSDFYTLTAQLHINEQVVLDRLPEAGARWGVPTAKYTGPIQYIEEGQIIPFGKSKFKVILTPGHSPGSVCFYNEAENYLIGGDLIFKDGVGRTDLPGSNPADLIKSIADKILPLPNETIIYSGHGPETTLGREKAANPYIKHILG
jgi:glyoxylase-like metal-dependent hydrolase (beta-lactamase superfamily II)